MQTECLWFFEVEKSKSLKKEKSQTRKPTKQWLLLSGKSKQGLKKSLLFKCFIICNIIMIIKIETAKTYSKITEPKEKW